MATVNQEFQSAPIGRRVIVTAIACFAVLLVMGVFNFFFAQGHYSHRSSDPIVGVVAPLFPMVGLLIAVPAFFIERARTSRFRIEENCLVLGRRRFPLEGLVEVDRDPDVLRRARKLWGNGGMGSIRGRFRNKRIGDFYAFLTCTENAVVLRWPDKAVAVSPEDPEFFILSARSAGGLR